MLKKHFIYCAISILITITISACTSSVRFTSDSRNKSTDTYSEKSNNNSSSKSSKKSSKNYSEDKSKYSKIPKNEASGSKSSKSQTYSSDLKGTRKQIIEEAQTWIGTPYSWGGESRSGADCSGFVMKVYKTAGIALPRTAAEQYTKGKPVDISNAKSGDLVFFSKDSGISHVGIYIGNNNILHSSSSKGVIVQNLSTMGMNPTFAGIKSIINN